MKNKTLWFVVIVVVFVGGLFLLLKNNGSYKENSPADNSSTNTSTNTNTNNNGAQTGDTSTNTGPNQYTMAEVASHNNKTDCWTTINGSVYNVTSWIPKHPGGSDKIIGLCGIDGSSAFNGQHGGQARPASELATFKIGTLKQ